MKKACSIAHFAGREFFAAAVSPDGRNLYVLSVTGGLTAFRVHGGRLTQLSGSAGCIDGTGADGCTQARGLGPTCCGIAVSPDSRNVYISSSTGGSQSATFALATFTRSSAGLSQLAGAAGCVDKDGSAGCAAAAFRGDNAINEAGAVLLSPNGRDIYLAHSSTFPEAESAGCVGHESRGCRPVRHVNAPDTIVMSGNHYVYVLSNDPVEGSTIGAFRRSLR